MDGVMQRIEITRSQYIIEWGSIPSPEWSGVVVYTSDGQPLVEYVFIDEEKAKEEVEWLEKLYQL